MPHTTPKPSRIPGPLHKAGLFVLFAAITAALCLLLNFLLVDDLHAYSRVTLGEYYAQADAVDTVFVGSSHSYRSFDPDTIDPILGSHSFNLGTSQQQPDGSYWLIREAAANSPLKTVYLETFYTGYNQQKSSNVPLACYLITDYMRASSPTVTSICGRWAVPRRLRIWCSRRAMLLLTPVSCRPCGAAS